MKVINTVELKNHTNEILREIKNGKIISITRRGKICAVLLPVKDENLEDIIFEHSPQFKKLVKEAEADLKAGRTVSWEEFLSHEKSHAS